MRKQIKVTKVTKVVKKKRTTKEKLQKELKELGDNIIVKKRVRKTALHKDEEYTKSTDAHKKICNPKGGFIKGSNANYDYYYDGKKWELPLAQDTIKYDDDFIVSDDDDFIVSDDGC